MVLLYQDFNGMPIAIEMGKIPLTIGRSSDADIVLQDEKISRLHCRLSYESGLYFIEDLNSKNGTTVNEHTITRSVLKSGDRIQVGNTSITVKDYEHPGTKTVMNDVQNQMEQGKGYPTIMREIVQEAAQKN